MKKVINVILRIIVFPLVLGIIWISYTYHAFKNAVCFLLYGGEWITYAKKDRETIQDIYLKLKENGKCQ